MLFLLVQFLLSIPAVEVAVVGDHQPSYSCQRIHQINRVFADDARYLIENDPALVVGILSEGGLLIRMEFGIGNFVGELELDGATD